MNEYAEISFTMFCAVSVTSVYQFCPCFSFKLCLLLCLFISVLIVFVAIHLFCLKYLEAPCPDFKTIEIGLRAAKMILDGLAQFMQQNSAHKMSESNQLVHAGKYKTSMCRDLQMAGGCPRGPNCTFAHSQDELEK